MLGDEEAPRGVAEVLDPEVLDDAEALAVLFFFAAKSNLHLL
jgi:hypothetical protein